MASQDGRHESSDRTPLDKDIKDRNGPQSRTRIQVKPSAEERVARSQSQPDRDTSLTLLNADGPILPNDQSQQSHSTHIKIKNNQLADNFIELAKLWNGGEDLDPNSSRDKSVLDTADKIRGMNYDVGDLIDRLGADYIREHDDWRDLGSSHATDLKLLAFSLTPQQVHSNRMTMGF